MIERSSSHAELSVSVAGHYVFRNVKHFAIEAANQNLSISKVEIIPPSTALTRFITVKTGPAAGKMGRNESQVTQKD